MFLLLNSTVDMCPFGQKVFQQKVRIIYSNRFKLIPVVKVAIQNGSFFYSTILGNPSEKFKTRFFGVKSDPKPLKLILKKTFGSLGREVFLLQLGPPGGKSILILGMSGGVA